MFLNGHRRMLKKMKYISDQEGIINRYMREKDNWNDHLNHTRRFIEEAFTDREIRTIAVLGSGWLLDCPIEKLSQRFTKILLADICHPPQIRKRMEQFPNVSLQELDLSGGAVEFAWNINGHKEDYLTTYYLDFFSPETPELLFEPDAFVSLNLLNQLDILVVDHIKRRCNCFQKVEYDRFRKTIQDAHIEWITHKPGCLVTDVEETTISPGGEASHTPLVHARLPEGRRNDQWKWEFDLSGTYTPNHKTTMNVKAIEW